MWRAAGGFFRVLLVKTCVFASTWPSWGMARVAMRGSRWACADRALSNYIHSHSGTFLFTCVHATKPCALINATLYPINRTCLRLAAEVVAKPAAARVGERADVPATLLKLPRQAVALQSMLHIFHEARTSSPSRYRTVSPVLTSTLACFVLGRTDGQTEYQPLPLSSFLSLARMRRKVEPLQPASQLASRQTEKSTRAAPAYEAADTFLLPR